MDNTSSVSKFELLSKRDKKYSIALIVILAIWFVFHAVILGIHFSSFNYVIKKAKRNRIANNENYFFVREYRNVLKKKLVKKKKTKISKIKQYKVIFNDYVMLHQIPDGKPISLFLTRDVARSTKIKGLTSDKVGGIKWYKINIFGSFKNVNAREGFIPEYGIIHNVKRKLVINKIRSKELKFRHFTKSLDLRGEWQSNKSNLKIFVNIDLSYLILYMDGIRKTYKLNKMYILGNNRYLLTTDGGFWFKYILKNNRQLVIFSSKISNDIEDIKFKKVLTGLFIKR